MDLTTSPLLHWDLVDKRIFLRSDLNVSIDNGLVINDFKLRASEPTIKHILTHGGKILLVTHMGTQKENSEHNSTKALIPWFQQRGYDPIFADSIGAARDFCNAGHSFVLLENERKIIDHQTEQASAKFLKALCDYYVNDAFGSLHRQSFSLTIAPWLFDFDKRSIGFLVEKELKTLAPVAQHADHPFVLIMGGNKFEKIKIIKHLMHSVDTLLLCPLLAELFSDDGQRSNNQSPHENVAKEIINYARDQGKKVVIPIDYQAKQDDSYVMIPAADQSEANVMSIGPKTAQLYSSMIHSSRTVLFNGLGGFLSEPETLRTTATLFQAMVESKALSIIAGGDSSAAAIKLGFENKISLISTGGGSTITYLAGLNLPALEPFLKD